MSTCYLPTNVISLTRLRSELPRTGLREDMDTRSSSDAMWLTDGRDRLWAFQRTENITAFVRYGKNNVENLLTRLSEYFETEFFPEYDETLYARRYYPKGTPCVASVRHRKR